MRAPKSSTSSSRRWQMISIGAHSGATGRARQSDGSRSPSRPSRTAGSRASSWRVVKRTEVGSAIAGPPSCSFRGCRAPCSVAHQQPAPCGKAGAEGAIPVERRWRISVLRCPSKLSRPFGFVFETGRDEGAHLRGKVVAAQELERAVRLGGQARVWCQTEKGFEVFLGGPILALPEVAQPQVEVCGLGLRRQGNRASQRGDRVVERAELVSRLAQADAGVETIRVAREDL